MQRKENIAVFCASSMGNHSSYAEQAKQLGRILAKQKRTLVYGGSNCGMMGALANATLENGGKILAMQLSCYLDEVVQKEGVTMEIFETLAERKIALIGKCDACIALPGGIGTLDELFEVYALAQSGAVVRPIGLLNIDGYYNGLLQFLKRGIADGLIAEKYKKMFLVSDTPDAMLSLLDQQTDEIL